MATQGSASAAAIIEDVVSSIVQETLIQRSVMLPSIDDRSSEVRAGMDRLSIARFTALTVGDITEGTEVTPQAATIAQDELVMDKNKAITWEIPDKADMQAKVDLAAQLVRDAARSHAAQVDDDIIAELKLASAAAPDHRVVWANAPANTVTVADIVEGRKLLNVQSVDLADRFMLVGPDQEKALLQIDNFISTEKYGNSEAVQNGELGRLFGMKVLMSTSANLAADEMLVYHRSACAYATQISPKFETQRNVLKVLDEYALSQLYGVKLLDSGKRNVLFNNDGL